jgi:hypothetical protein
MNPEPSSFWDLLVRLNDTDLAALLAAFSVFGTLLIIVIAVIVSKTIYRVHKNRLENALKHELVERGFSPTEIVEIISASASPSAALPACKGRGAPKEIEHAYAR